MQSRLRSKALTIVILLSFLLEVFFLSPGSVVFAQQNYRRSGHAAYRPGHVVAKLPRGHHTVHVGQKKFYYRQGIFYRQNPKGFAVVRPPVGAVIVSLPVGVTTAVIAGMTYFLFAEAYYRPVPAGYMVVEPEVPGKPPAVAGYNVSVTAALLNVRSQPGTEHAIISQVARGSLLMVRGQAPGWLYVNLPDGGFGWVMARYTHRRSPPASG